jgi:hypothetical protein
MRSQLSKKIAIVAIAAAFIAAGCSKPDSKPQPLHPATPAAELEKIIRPPNADLSQLPQPKEGAPRPNDSAQKNATDKLLADFAEHLKHVPPITPPPSAETYALANQSRAAANNPPAAPGPAAATAPASVYIASIEEFTELIRKSGFDPHPADPGMLPYFDALSGPAGSYEEVGVPGRLRMFYFLMDDNKSMYFIVPIRIPRGSEEPTFDQIMQSPRDSDRFYARDLIRKLQAANPAPHSTQFAVRGLPMGGMNGMQVVQPTIVVGGGFYNPSPDPHVIMAAIAEMIMVLHATKDIWK